MVTLGLFGILFALLFLGLPVLYSIGISSLVGFHLTPGVPIALIPQRMFAMLDKFSLLALPYFILAGHLMQRGGIAKQMIEFSDALVGHVRGSLAMANVMASMVFAGVSGSSTADTSAVGSILIPAMVEQGYKKGFSAAITATSSTIGPIIPPSMTMIIYGSMTGVSIGGLFMAGIIPGILIGVSLMFTIYLLSFHPNYPELRRTTGDFSLKRVLTSAKKVWPALVAPFIILGGIVGGVFTATEAGVVTCFYSLFIGFFVYKTLRIRDIPDILYEAAITTSVVAGIIAVAGAFGWLLIRLDFDKTILQLILNVSTNPTVVMLMLLGAMLILTMFIESLAVLILLVPIMAQLSNMFGFNPFHFGLLVVMTCQIGAVTPPVCVLMFVTTSIAGVPLEETIKAAMPFIFTLLVVLLLVVFFPPLATYIPSLFM